MNKKTKSVVAAVIRDGERVFATQRGYGEFKDGWEFPGGKIEPGETAEEALVREIREELDPGFPRIHTSLTLTIRPETLGNIEFNCIFTCHPLHSVV